MSGPFGKQPLCPYVKIEVMLRILAFALLATALPAQDSVKPVAKPPAKVDQALRARVNQFYQDFMKGRFSDAETLVAPETRNYFISIRKEKYTSCEVKGVDYSDKFKFAQVAAVCERNIMFQGFVGHPLKSTVASAWKLEHGKWYWYVDPNAPHVGPMGLLGALMPRAGAVAPPSSPAQAGQPAPAAAPVVLPTLAALTTPDIALHKVSADKQSLALKTGESGGVAFSNSALGAMSVSLYGAPPEGFEVTPTKADLQPNGKATVAVKALEGAKSAVLNFQVFPTGEVISVKVDIP
jgi:hypothetical protein